MAIGQGDGFVAIGWRGKGGFVVEVVAQGGQWDGRGDLLRAQLRYGARQLVHAKLRHVGQVASRQAVADHLQVALRCIGIVRESEVPVRETVEGNRELGGSSPLLIADLENGLLRFMDVVKMICVKV